MARPIDLRSATFSSRLFTAVLETLGTAGRCKAHARLLLQLYDTPPRSRSQVNKKRQPNSSAAFDSRLSSLPDSESQATVAQVPLGLISGRPSIVLLAESYPSCVNVTV